MFFDHPTDLIEEHSSSFRAIAGDLYGIFEHSGGQSVPRWDVEGQGYHPLNQKEVRTLPNFEWIKDSSPVGTVLSVGGWEQPVGGWEQQIASRVGVSAGALPNEILDWIQLPCPDFAAKDTAIAHFWRRLVVMPFELQQTPDAFKSACNELRRQLSRTSVDVAWLNSWVHHLMCEIPSDVEIRWYERLSSVIPVLPCPDLRAKRLTWPATSLTSGPLIHYQCSPQPIDTVVDQPPYDEVKFAVEVGQCVVCLSQGSDLDAPIPKCNAALEVVRCELKSDENDALRTSLSILLVALRDYHRRIDWDVAYPKKISIERAITDTLNEVHGYARELPTTVTRGGINRVIERLVAVSVDVDVRITPAGLDYANSSQWDENNASPHPEFSDDKEKGRVELSRFGVFAAGEIIQECEAVCSLGPAPPGQKTLKKLAQIAENSGVESTSQSFHKSLKNLPRLVYQADRGDDHELLAELERLHQAYWSEIRPKGILPEDQLVKCDNSLRKLLEHYSLLTYPVNQTFMSDFRTDVEHWFQYGSSVKLIDSTLRRGDRVQRGKIAKVVKPGLYYKGEDRPRVFATVELEAVRSSAS